MHFCAASKQEWQITSVSGLDAGILIALLVTAVFVVFLTWRSLDPRHPRRSRVVITTLRLFAILVCFGLLLQPTLHIRQLKSEPTRLAVLIDTSGSMTQGEGWNRLSKAKRIIKRARAKLETLEKRFRVAWFGFADEVMRIESVPKIDEAIRPSKKTDMVRSVQSLAELSKDTALGGVVLIGDGADTELSMNKDGKWPMTAFTKLGVPVNTVFVGDNKTRPDLAISHVKIAPFAFTRSETPITVSLTSVGLEERKVEAFLKQDGAVLQRRTADIVGNKGQLTFKLLPTDLGQQVYEISVPVPKGDLVPENNRQNITLEVIRDKIRILHLAGRPSWDQRFLRQTLKSWPNIDLVSFYVLRTAYQSATEGSAGMALIPFPTEELFEDHLGEFDILIFHEFEPVAVGVETYAKKIASFVAQGGALVLVAGEQGLKSGIMGNKALEDVLPVEFLPAGTPANRLVESSQFRPRLTEAGSYHPITRIYPAADENKRIWRSLFRLDGVGRVAGLMTGAQSLVEHPILLSKDGPAPLVAVREVGKGRTMAVMTDMLWSWRFAGPMGGEPSDVYTTFWKKGIAWLTDAPELKRLRVSVKPSPVLLGDKATFSVELLDASYQPIPGETVSYRITWIGEDGVRGEESFSAQVDVNGKYQATWTPKVEAAHRIEVTSSEGLKNATSFLVANDNRERYNMDPNPSLLKAIAKETGGHFSENGIHPDGFATHPTGGRSVLSQLAATIWDHPLALIVFFGLVASEWLLRRRLGLR